MMYSGKLHAIIYFALKLHKLTSSNLIPMHKHSRDESEFDKFMWQMVLDH